MADEYFLLVCDDVPHDIVLTDPGPAVVLDGVPEEDAVAAVSALRGAGAQAETRARSEPGS
ncbi:hypothetical protein [Streptomyces chartreusis]|uniref:hypothetical protein n=1 Tax=Streptomyces chartreusis TaxID=1969 RepID=UPI003628E08C